MQVALNDSNADLVVTLVSGKGQALHPLDKFDVAARVADAILARAGVKGVVASGPTFQKVITAGRPRLNLSTYIDMTGSFVKQVFHR